MSQHAIPISSNRLVPRTNLTGRVSVHHEDGGGTRLGILDAHVVGSIDYHNVLYWGATGDGTTDDSARIQNCLDLNGPGGYYFPPGTYRVKDLAVDTGQHLFGAGINATILKLPDNVSSSTGCVIITKDTYTYWSLDSGSYSNPNNFSIKYMTIDGNSSNNTSPPNPDNFCGIRLYGYCFCLDQLRVRFTRGTGIVHKWIKPDGGSAGVDDKSPNASVSNINIESCFRHGLWHLGPNDSYFHNVCVVNASIEADATYNGVYLQNNGTGRFHHLHSWVSTGANRPAYSCNVTNAANQFNQCHFEGGRQQLNIANQNNSFLNCQLYANTSTNPLCVVSGGFNNLINCHFKLSESSSWLNAPMLELGTAGTPAFNYRIFCTFDCNSEAGMIGVPPLKVTNATSGWLDIEIYSGSFVYGATSPWYTGTLPSKGYHSMYQNSDGRTLYQLHEAVNIDTQNDRYFFGANAGKDLSGTPTSVVGVGNSAARDNAGNNVIAIGNEAAMDNTGSFVVCIGGDAGHGNQGSNCVGIGRNTLGGTSQNNSGSSHVAIGTNAMQNSTTSVQNTVVGVGAASAITTAGNNCVYGYNAGTALTTGGTNSIFGATANVSAGTVQRAICLGYAATATASGQFALGSASANINTSTSANAGGGGSLPGTVEGYLEVNINGLGVRKIPFYLT